MKNFSKKWFVYAFMVVLSMYAVKPVSAQKKVKKIIIDENSPSLINESTLNYKLKSGDTIFIASTRTKALKFENIRGHAKRPIVVINYGGLVNIDDQNSWGAINFENCRYIKISGSGDADYKYGFKLAATHCGLAFSELSSNCEAEFVMIDHDGFFGISAKKDYGGKPPRPMPVFYNLTIHDCFIQNVTEGMYLGETITPGMKFRDVKIYNNIVLNTGREAIQCSNMVENVEIYNNTLINAGNDNISSQSNLLQIGDNTVSEIYNNIISQAPAFGIISLGMGNNHMENNYISNCRGIFIDNRTVTNSDYSISVVGNYFKDIVGYEVVKNMNELNPLFVTDNFYDCEIDFFANASGNEENVLLENNTAQAIDVIEFTDPLDYDYSLAENTPFEFQAIGAPGGPIYFGNENPYLPPIIEESEQIVLSADMVVDEVSGGSLQSPNLCVDEQTVGLDAHPLSNHWKPAYNMNNGPYSFYIDLQKEYHLTQIALHDTYDEHNLEVWFGEPGNWELLLVESCDGFKVWKQHFVSIDTRYVRFTMSESVFAAVNEVMLYGSGLQETETLNSASLKSGVIEENSIEKLNTNVFLLFPNPVKNELNISVPDNFRIAGFTLSVFDINGRVCMQREYNQHTNKVLRLNIAEYGLKQGVYIVNVSNENGINKSMRFLKK